MRASLAAQLAQTRVNVAWISGAFIRPCFSAFRVSGLCGREAVAELAVVPPRDFDGELVVAGVE